MKAARRAFAALTLSTIVTAAAGAEAPGALPAGWAPGAEGILLYGGVAADSDLALTLDGATYRVRLMHDAIGEPGSGNRWLVADAGGRRVLDASLADTLRRAALMAAMIRGAGDPSGGGLADRCRDAAELFRSVIAISSRDDTLRLAEEAGAALDAWLGGHAGPPGTGSAATASSPTADWVADGLASATAARVAGLAIEAADALRVTAAAKAAMALECRLAMKAAAIVLESSAAIIDGVAEPYEAGAMARAYDGYRRGIVEGFGALACWKALAEPADWGPTMRLVYGDYERGDRIPLKLLYTSAESAGKLLVLERFAGALEACRERAVRLAAPFEYHDAGLALYSTALPLASAYESRMDGSPTSWRDKLVFHFGADGTWSCARLAGYGPYASSVPYYLAGAERYYLERVDLGGGSGFFSWAEGKDRDAGGRYMMEGGRIHLDGGAAFSADGATGRLRCDWRVLAALVPAWGNVGMGMPWLAELAPVFGAEILAVEPYDAERWPEAVVAGLDGPADRLNVRRDPEVGAVVVARLAGGARVRVLARSDYPVDAAGDGVTGYWYRVVTPGLAEGWAFGRYLDTGSSEPSALPVEYP